MTISLRVRLAVVAAAAVLFITGMCTGCQFTTVAAVDNDVGIESGLSHTVLMTEGCTAVSIGDGLVLTAAHCVKGLELGAMTSIGELRYRSSTRDFAVLYDPKRVASVRATLRAPIAYEHIYVIGYPGQLATDKQELTVTDGLVAGPIVPDSGEYRITAPIWFGNSGGGVWGEDGALVGLSVRGYVELPGMNYIVSVGDIIPVISN